MSQADTKNKMYFYESFASEFDSKMNMYDTNKRIEIIYNDFLGNEDLKNKKVLDAGCGTGWFSKAAAERGAAVTSMDLGENLLAEVAKKCKSERVVGSILEIPFPENTFDFVVSSEVIEHTPDPYKALHEIYRVLKPGGTMVLSTPNKFWYWSLWIAEKLNLRPYQGLENWSGFYQLKNEAIKAGFKVEKLRGVHIIPFVHPATYPVNNFFHRFNKFLGPVMVNIVIKAKK
jgi:2-polyprenyl-3-methyl-5-hydroxy-6-metoxy-1,4-benzoquinol methylase